MILIRLVAVNERGHPIGEFHHNARLSDAQVDRIRELHEDEGLGYKRIAKLLGISRNTVHGICVYKRRAESIAGWKKLSVSQPYLCEKSAENDGMLRSIEPPDKE